ncbi:hypothetical protein E8E13_007754 [Curvularia kusanoi]|uniref:WD40 repeat-like protein n=1 Tax=Curvularia kusanoi TaxID=90978 RepID=A0A9P4TC70_CURKU|nr:hypothetical protein E8E13_007754 [Curvularia kusanoi]
MASSVTGREVVDLTLDEDEDVQIVSLGSGPRPVPTQQSIAPTTTTTTTTTTHVTHPSALPPTATAAINMAPDAPTPKNYTSPLPTTSSILNDALEAGRKYKRRKLSPSGDLANRHQNTQHDGRVNGTHASPAAQSSNTATSGSNTSLRAKLNALNGTPSVQYMNSALKSASDIPLLDAIPAQAPRPIFANRKTESEAGSGLLSPGLTTPESAAAVVIDLDDSEDDAAVVVRTVPLRDGLAGAGRGQESQLLKSTAVQDSDNDDATPILGVPPQKDGPAEPIRVQQARLLTLSPRPKLTALQYSDDEDSALFQHLGPPKLADAATQPDNDDDSVVSRTSLRQATPRDPQQSQVPMLASALSPVPASSTPLKTVHTGSDEEKVDHLLIFLKEVRKFKWQDITTEFAKDIPGYQYTKLQSRYSTKVNKRDRTQDPPTLNLPPRFAAEATVNWATVHADTVGSNSKWHSFRKDGAGRGENAVRKRNKEPHMQQTEDDDFSGSDVAPRRRRAQRAPPVNYKLPKLLKLPPKEGQDEWDDEEDIGTGSAPNGWASIRSRSPIDSTIVTAVKKPPPSRLAVDFLPMDAELGLAAQRGQRKVVQKQMPYLSSTDLSAMRDEPEQWIWEHEKVEDWQGAVVHVDFNHVELQTVEEVILKTFPPGRQSRHSTYRRHLRSLLRGLSVPNLHRLAHEISRQMRSRNFHSIVSFIKDAIAGTISDVPRIQRLAVAKPSSTFSGFHKLPVPVSSITRNRELGLQSRRGWRTASAPVSYQTKNQLLDTLGPKSTWTGASSDIHTVAWSPDGQSFAAGAVAVTDSDSMQYNRPNVLLYGSTVSGNIHELGQHCIDRPKTEKGANSTHAMYVSQDPKLYTTVSSVAFAPSGDLMYSAGYDGHVVIWDITKGAEQPKLLHKLQHKAPVEILAVNPNYNGNIATATKRTTRRSIKLMSFDEEEVLRGDTDWRPERSNFASGKALERPDLNMSVNALKYDPTGRYLLAGFGANVGGDNGFHLSGDICIWDVGTQEALPVHGNSRNVFDLTFNPTSMNNGLFAVGCVANGQVNPGTRSVVRFFDWKEMTSGAKYAKAIELECKALDMNDVVWCPYDGNIFAAGCTDARVYIWDIRKPNKELYTLSHGVSLMPLQDGVPPERTDTGIRFLSWGPNARRLYSGSSDGVVRVWDVTQSEEDMFVKDLITTKSGIMSGAFTSDYGKLVLGEVNGTANVLEVGRDDIALKDAETFKYHPYIRKSDSSDEFTTSLSPGTTSPHSAELAESRTWLETGALQLAPMGGLPKHQVIQGPNYTGPYDLNSDAYTLHLREQAFEFQHRMFVPRGLQCSLSGCADNMNTTTYEEIGDSGRSRDRVPDELRRQWVDETTRSVPGKTKCAICGRPAFPSTSATSTDALCERCGFACLRCGARTRILATARRVGCTACGGEWSIGALGFECVGQPHRACEPPLHVPSLDAFAEEVRLQSIEDVDAAFGDEMNALSEYYFGLAIARPESPSL